MNSAVTLQDSIPVIETQRLRLRAPRAEDFEAYLAIWSEPAVFRFTLGVAPAREDAWMRYLRNLGHWALMGVGTWLIEERASGRIIGDVGIFDFKRTVTPSLEGKLEIGWVLSGAAHGEGFASEAARAAINWLNRERGEQEIYCIISPENASSLRLAEKLNFKPISSTIYKSHAIIMLRREPGRLQ